MKVCFLLLQSGCNHVLREPTPTFARLEHYRIHEFAKAAAGKNYRTQASAAIAAASAATACSIKTADIGSRRRGRPPKYPKMSVPYVPKVELTPQEIRDSSRASVDGEGTGVQEKIINGFRR
jgi:hypothetical protein